ncbi:MAG TPA: ABC transporter permease [Mycobacteriales bacterium]|jgi:ABC-type dipeptide/oligopeptide/nickel transport systems, permease components
MLRYVLRRVVSIIPVLFGVTLVMFIVSHSTSADPTALMLGDRASADPELVAAFHEKWGLDQPLPVQYGHYLVNLVHGDLGMSIFTQRPVLDDLMQYFPATVELATLAAIISVCVSIPLGVIAAIRPHGLTDGLIRTLTLLGSSMPIFWLALVALQLFYFQWGVAAGPGRMSSGSIDPEGTGGFYATVSLFRGDWATFSDVMSHMILPAIVLASWSIGVITRVMRNSMMTVLQQDYLRTARAKGATDRYIFTRHGFRNALMPVVTLTGTAFAELLAGAVTTEMIFAWPGIGRYSYQAATALDFPAIMGVGLLVAFVYLIVNLAVDLLYPLLDPRVKVAAR